MIELENGSASLEQKSIKRTGRRCRRLVSWLDLQLVAVNELFRCCSGGVYRKTEAGNIVRQDKPSGTKKERRRQRRAANATSHQD